MMSLDNSVKILNEQSSRTEMMWKLIPLLPSRDCRPLTMAQKSLAAN